MASSPKDQELEGNKHNLSRGFFPTKIQYLHMLTVWSKLVLFCLMIVITDMNFLSKNKLNLARDLVICLYCYIGSMLNILLGLKIKYVCLF